MSVGAAGSWSALHSQQSVGCTHQLQLPAVAELWSRMQPAAAAVCTRCLLLRSLAVGVLQHRCQLRPVVTGSHNTSTESNSDKEA